MFEIIQMYLNIHYYFFIMFMGHNIMLSRKIELDHIVGTGKKVNIKKRVQRFNDLGFRSVDL